MLQHILAVITASVSLAGCNAGSKEPMERLSDTVKRPVVDRRPDDSASRDHVGSQAATVPDGAAQAGNTATAAGTGGLGPGSNENETSARGSSLDSTPARGTTSP